MIKENKILIGNTGEKEILFDLKMANRHGIISGATGTGKTTTLKTLAEGFSEAGVPVFFCDVKGDLAGISKSHPVTFWDIYGKNGIPCRTTISEMGPTLLAKLMDLNDTQSDILTVVFKIADDQNLLLIDTKDLKSMLQYVADNADDFTADYGNIAKQSVTTILRNIVALEAKGGSEFFQEPALNISDWFQTGMNGYGMLNILDCRQLVSDATMYSTFLLWMLSELFETLPEVGDLDKPRIVFFFDESHLIFRDINKALGQKIEQVVKLIRSKGVGVYFISQSPRDIPDAILSQLGNKIQHGLRAYTPADEKVVRTVADTFRSNSAFDTYDTLLNLGTGEALVSLLEQGGVPQVVEKCKITAPISMDVKMTDEEIGKAVLISNTYLRYQNTVDRDSAYEFFQRMKKQELEEIETVQMTKEQEKADKEAMKLAEKEQKELLKQQEKYNKLVKSQAKKVASSAVGTIGREAGKAIGKTIGGSFGKTLGGNVGAQLGRSILGTLLK